MLNVLVSAQSDQLDLKVEELGQMQPIYEVHNSGEVAVGVAFVVADDGHPQLNSLPEVLMVHFRYRDVETILHAVDNSLDHPALSLKGAVVAQVKSDGADAYEHRWNKTGWLAL